MTWTNFMDMNSGGDQKLEHSDIYIEAPRELAIRIFEHKFNRDPYNVTCECCGRDYRISEVDNVDDILPSKHILFIDIDEIRKMKT